MKPFIELSFMPRALASTSKTCFHYLGNISLPGSYVEWSELIVNLTVHLIERYGIGEVRQWFFEVWNEPNLSFFFEGTQEDYFELYGHTARAIKSVDQLLPVGGPSTSNNAWITELIQYCETQGIPLDFISTHHYPTDDPLWSGQVSKEYYDRGVLTQMAVKAKKEGGKYPLYYTEWNSSAKNPDELHDTPYTAALVMKTIIDNMDLVEAYSFWTYTDIFEEGGQFAGEFYGGYGLQTVHGIPKAAYHTFEFLHRMGAQKLPVTKEQETVGMLASVKEEKICIVAYNHHVPDSYIEEQTVSLRIQHKSLTSAKVYLVDEDHGNAYHMWKEIGAPIYPNTKQLEELYASSNAFVFQPDIKIEGEETILEFLLSPHGIAYVELV